MSAREIAAQEFVQSGNPKYLDPEVLKIRMEYWDLGMKNEPRCIGRSKPIGPDDVTSCECMKAGTNTAAVCTMKEGYKCIMTWPLNSGFEEGDVAEKGLTNCNPNFPMRILPSEQLLSVPVGAAIVDEKNGHLIIIGLAILLVLAQLYKII